MSEQVEVEILTQAITAQYGVLSAGDVLRTDAAFAAHLVDDCGAAKYTKAVSKAKLPTAAEPEETTAEQEKPAVKVGKKK